MSKSLTLKSIKIPYAKWLYNKVSKNMMSKSHVKIDLLHNKILLYVVFIVSLANLLIWIVGGDIVNVIIFLLVGFLTAFFSKNMIVILFFALVVSNIIKFGIHIGKEGFSEGVEGEDDEEHKRRDGFEHDGIEGVEDGEDGREGIEDGEDGREGIEDGEDGREGIDEDNAKITSDDMKPDDTKSDGKKPDGKKPDYKKPDGKKPDDKLSEGMQTLGYTFIAQDNLSSSLSTMVEQQNKLLSNISAMSPYVINVDNESKLRSQMKYSEYVTH